MKDRIWASTRKRSSSAHTGHGFARNEQTQLQGKLRRCDPYELPVSYADKTQDESKISTPLSRCKGDIYLRVVVYNDQAHVNGGAGKIALDGAVMLAGSGHEVHVLCAVGPIDEALLKTPNLTVHCTHQHDLLNDPDRLRAMTQGLWNVPARQLCAGILQRLDPSDTVVHVHTWAKALTSSVVREAADRGFPIVLTVHDFLIACPTGTLFLHPVQQKCTLKPMSLSCICTNCDARSYPQKLWRVARQVVQQNPGQFPAAVADVIFYSDLAERLMTPYVPSGAAIHQLPSYIDAIPGEAADVASNEACYYLGRLVPEKGVVLLAEAAREAGVPAVFVGDGFEREAVLAAYPQATVTGWVSHAQGLLMIRRARALVFPSLWYETMGLVVMEAAAQGVPSIIADETAAAQWVDDGATGLYFRSGDRHDLARKIEQMMDPHFAAQLGRAAQTKFQSLPGRSKAQHIRGLEAVYRQALERKRLSRQV